MQTHLHTDTFTYILFLSFFVCASTCEDSFFYREIETFSGSRFKTDDKQKKKKLFGIATWTPHDWNDIKQQSSMPRKFSLARERFCDAGTYARPYSSSLVIRVEKFVQLKNI